MEKRPAGCEIPDVNAALPGIFLKDEALAVGRCRDCPSAKPCPVVELSRLSTRAAGAAIHSKLPKIAGVSVGVALLRENQTAIRQPIETLKYVAGCDYGGISTLEILSLNGSLEIPGRFAELHIGKLLAVR